MYTIYSKFGCPYCDKIKHIMELVELQHVVYNLGSDYNLEEFYGKFGEGSTFPQVVLDDDKFLGGCTDTVGYLKENNII
jgi:glutaredoxin